MQLFTNAKKAIPSMIRNEINVFRYFEVGARAQECQTRNEIFTKYTCEILIGVCDVGAGI